MRARQNPSQSEPTSPSSSDASPKEPGAAAPGPTPYVVTGNEAPTRPIDDLKKWQRRARECGGIVRVK